MALSLTEQFPGGDGPNPQFAINSSGRELVSVPGKCEVFNRGASFGEPGDFPAGETSTSLTTPSGSPTAISFPNGEMAKCV